MDNQSIRKGFLQDTFKLGSGTTLAQIATILSVPFLSRLYSETDFGIATMFGAIIMTLATISGLRYELAILLPKKESDGFHLLTLQIGITIIFSLLTGLVIGLNRVFLADLFNAPILADYLWFVGPGVLIFGILNGLNYWHTRLKRFSLLAQTKFASSIVTVFVQLFSGFVGFVNPGGLIAGILLGKTAEDAIQAGKARFDKRNFNFSSNYHEIIRLARRYKKFPIFNTLSALTNTLSWQLPALLLSMLFNAGIAGFYGVGERVIRTPMNMVGRAVAQVFFQHGSEAHRQGALGKVYLDTAQMLVKVGFFPALLLSLIGKEIFIVFLGGRRAEAGVYAQLLGMWAFVWFLASPTSTIMSIAEKQEKALIFNLINLATRIGSLIIGGLLNQPEIALALFSIAGILTYGWLLLWVGEIAGVKWHHTMVSIFSRYEIFSIFFILIIALAKFSGMHNFGLLGLAAVELAAYYFILFRKYGYLLGR